MRQLLFFDFDGPILDVRQKYYRAYSNVLANLGFSPIDADSYWGFKRGKTPDLDILFRSRAEDSLEKYWSLREKIIETQEFLDIDVLQPNVLEILARLKSRFEFALITMRSSEKGVFYQLKRLGLDVYFPEVLCSGAAPELHDAHRPKWEIKHAMASKYLIRKNHHPRSVAAMVGDTETDVRCAQALGCKAVAVECGIRSRELLSRERPDAIIPDLGLLESCL